MGHRPDATPAYRKLSGEQLIGRVQTLRSRYSDCDLCAHECGVDRTKGETGACQTDETPVVASYSPHRGEEDVLSGRQGSGTIFLSNCNLRCVFCQNFDISQHGRGEPSSAQDIARIALELQDRGCHNVNFVAPTHYTPHLVEAIAIARERGLDIPVVWNCGGYERPEIISRLDGIVDIYMPDLKWSEEDLAIKYSGTPDYWPNARESIREMHRQVGDLSVDENGLATRGLLVRHLVMPGLVENTKRVLTFLRDEIGEQTYVNVMSQYRPAHLVTSTDRYPDIDRRITRDEYREVVSHARDIGLERAAVDTRLIGSGG